jgi:hypothetical protein
VPLDLGRAITELSMQVRDANLMLREVVDYLDLPRPAEILAANAIRMMAVMLAGTANSATSDEELLRRLKAFPPAKPFRRDLSERKFRVLALQGFAEFRSMPQARRAQYRKSSPEALTRVMVPSKSRARSARR